MVPRSSCCSSTDSRSLEQPHSRAARPVYSEAQIQAYCQYIGLPSPYSESPIWRHAALAQETEHGLPLLTALMRHNMTTIPFENLGLHYSANPGTPLDLDELMSRLVTSQSGRGGHCLQLNSFFGAILRSIGFTVRHSAARVNTACQAVARDPHYSGPSYNGWDHMINLVTFADQTYLVDVGMNARGPTVPILLADHGQVSSLPPRMVRLIRGCLPEQSWCGASNKMWQLQIRDTDDGLWIPTYAFSELEWIPADFEVINWYITTHRKSWFTHKVVVGKMLLDDEGKEIVGCLTLYEQTLKKRVRGQVEFQILCNSERERVEVIEQYFDIHLGASERNAIQGTMSAIP